MANTLDTLMQSATKCKRLSDLLHSGVLEQGRSSRCRAPTAFRSLCNGGLARFSFMMRRVFFRLMHDDLNAILDGARIGKKRGVTLSTPARSGSPPPNPQPACA